MHGSRNGREAGSPIHTGRAAWWWRTIGGASSCTGGLAGRNTIFAWHTKSSSSEASAQPLGPISVFYLPTIHPALSLSVSLSFPVAHTWSCSLSLSLVFSTLLGDDGIPVQQRRPNNVRGVTKALSSLRPAGCCSQFNIRGRVRVCSAQTESSRHYGTGPHQLHGKLRAHYLCARLYTHTHTCPRADANYNRPYAPALHTAECLHN